MANPFGFEGRCGVNIRLIIRAEQDAATGETCGEVVERTLQQAIRVTQSVTNSDGGHVALSELLQ